MKTIITIALIASSFICLSQADTTKPKKNWNIYLSASLSTSTGNNFDQNSFSGIELGLCYKNLNFGLCTGRGNFSSTSGPESLSNYWYEVHTTANWPLGSVKGQILLGWGQYYNSNHSFIEYGVGLTKSIKKFDVGLLISNWDNAVYLSPGITRNF